MACNVHNTSAKLAGESLESVQKLFSIYAQMVQYFGEFFCVILTTYPNMSPIPPKYQPPPKQQTPIFVQILPPTPPHHTPPGIQTSYLALPLRPPAPISHPVSPRLRCHISPCLRPPCSISILNISLPIGIYPLPEMSDLERYRRRCSCSISNGATGVSASHLVWYPHHYLTERCAWPTKRHSQHHTMSVFLAL